MAKTRNSKMTPMTVLVCLSFPSTRKDAMSKKKMSPALRKQSAKFAISVTHLGCAKSALAAQLPQLGQLGQSCAELFYK